jgi:hypothetical protein
LSSIAISVFLFRISNASATAYFLARFCCGGSFVRGGHLHVSDDLKNERTR